MVLIAKKPTARRAAKRSLPILIERDEDGFVVAECPLFRGCYSQGKTVDEALANVRQVIELVLEEPDNRARLADYQPAERRLYSLTM
jgi:predicted RNase H-like HicB family nuclease